MAMTKEEQKAAADRIMAKLGPLTAEEREIYDLLAMKVGEYPKPGERRKGPPNPSPAQWTEAYEKIQAGKERAKGKVE